MIWNNILARVTSNYEIQCINSEYIYLVSNFPALSRAGLDSVTDRDVYKICHYEKYVSSSCCLEKTLGGERNVKFKFLKTLYLTQNSFWLKRSLNSYIVHV